MTIFNYNIQITTLIITVAGYDRARNAYITVAMVEADIFYGSGNEDNLCSYYDGVLNQYYTLINCNSAISGQFVQLQFYTLNHLNLYEVEVHGM